MANFLSNGMSVSSVARQMGITRATVYSRLRKYDLIKPDEDLKVRLNPTLNDLGHAGAWEHGFNVIKSKPYRKNRKEKL